MKDAMARPSVQPPAGVERKAALYAAGLKRQDTSDAARPAAGILDKLRQAHREFHAFAQLLGAPAGRWGRGAQPFHPREQGVEALGEQLLTERRIASRARKVRFGHLGIGDLGKSAHKDPFAKAPWGGFLGFGKAINPRLLLPYHPRVP
jgi:hypothetical protein